MNDGWIKMYFKLREWEWYSDPFMVSLWVHLLIEAAWKPRKWKGITIQRGQVVTTIEALAESCGISTQQARTRLEKLKINKQINKQITNKYTIITICKYDDYQANQEEQEQTNNNQNNKQITNNQRNPPQTPHKKDYSEGEEYTPPTPPIGFEIYGKFFNVFLKAAERRKLVEDFGEGEVAAAIEDFSCQLADGTAKPSINHYATLVYWLTYRRKNLTASGTQKVTPGREVIGSKFVDRD